MRAGVALVGLVVAGCGPGGPTLYPVTGVVVFRDGGVVRTGVIELEPESGGPAARSTLDSTGRFTLTTDTRPGAVAGRHRVVVVQVALAPAEASHPRHTAGLVHPKHARFATSGLIAEVTSGPNDLTIEVDPAPPSRR